MLHFEQAAWDRSYVRVAGVDEAGRGPLAGPVVVAAAFFDVEFLKAEANGILAGITDSKKLSPGRREYFYDLLIDSSSVYTSIGFSHVDEINSINILQATHKAMLRALAGLTPEPDHALIDGRSVPHLPCSSTAIIAGDHKSLSIASASILAKVTRDRYMLELDRKHPQYGFARHKGYGTKEHIEALRRYGPAECHRKSFRPVSDVLTG